MVCINLRILGARDASVKDGTGGNEIRGNALCLTLEGLVSHHGIFVPSLHCLRLKSTSKSSRLCLPPSHMTTSYSADTLSAIPATRAQRHRLPLGASVSRVMWFWVTGRTAPFIFSVRNVALRFSNSHISIHNDMLQLYKYTFGGLLHTQNDQAIFFK